MGKRSESNEEEMDSGHSRIIIWKYYGRPLTENWFGCHEVCIRSCMHSAALLPHATRKPFHFPVNTVLAIVVPSRGWRSQIIPHSALLLLQVEKADQKPKRRAAYVMPAKLAQAKKDSLSAPIVPGLDRRVIRPVDGTLRQNVVQLSCSCSSSASLPEKA
jgi:hypothetical protein